MLYHFENEWRNDNNEFVADPAIFVDDLTTEKTNEEPCDAYRVGGLLCICSECTAERLMFGMAYGL